MGEINIILIQAVLKYFYLRAQHKGEKNKKKIQPHEDAKAQIIHKIRKHIVFEVLKWPLPYNWSCFIYQNCCTNLQI